MPRTASVLGVCAGLRVAILALLIPFVAMSQTDRGTITGTVADPAGALVPGAAVTARNAETGAIHETKTTETGNYTLPSLPAGNYELSVEAAGFSKYVQRGIGVQVVQTARINVKLRVGSTSESVIVTADAPLLRTESAEQSLVITGDTINALPLTFAGGLRSPIAFAQLAPGTSIPAGGNLTMRVNGAPSSTFRVLMDGQDITSGIDASHLSENHPSVEALQEVSLQSSNYSAEFGQAGGGLFNLTSRSGTNRFHGSAYEYLTNEALNAGRPYTNDGKGNLIRPRARNHNFGFSVGGPVVLPKLYNGQNKTFFFFNHEQFQTRERFVGTFTTVPTAAYRQGDFSAALTGRNLGTDPLGRAILENTIYDPRTSREVNGRIVRDPFPNNVIPRNLFDPVALKIQALMPAPTNSFLVDNLAASGDMRVTTKGIPSVKADHNFGSRTKVSFYYGGWRQDDDQPDFLPDPISPRRQFWDRTHTFRLSLDQTVSPSFMIHAGVGVMRYVHRDSAPQSTLAYDAPGLLGLKGSATTPAGFPRITGLSSPQGGMASGLGPTNANTYYNDKPTAVISATKIRSSHTFKAGAEWRVDVFTDRNFRGSQGIYQFNAAETALPYLDTTNIGGGSIGFPYASFLLGSANQASVQSIQDPQVRKSAWGMYVQDTWRVTRRLTLDYGVRWDYQDALRETHDRFAVFGPTIPNPSAGGLLGAVSYAGYGPGRCNCDVASTYPYAIGPRLGGAYQIDSKTVLRAGWGLVYSTTANSNYITQQGLHIGVGYNTLPFASPTFGEPAVNLRNGLQYNTEDLSVARRDPGIRPLPGQINSPPPLVDRNAGRPGRINQWNISLQREVATNLIVEAAYVGNRGVWLQSGAGWLGGDGLVNLNGLTPQRIASFGLDINNAADRQLLTSPVSSALAQSRGFRAPYAGWPTGRNVAQSLRPYPQFGDISSKWAPLGNTWYDALQVKVTKRYSHNFGLSGGFTWQKELNLGALSGLGYESEPANDVFNRQQNKYISRSSQPLVMTVGFNYQSPRVGQNRWVSTVLRDWTVSGFLRYASGTPIQSPAAQNNLAQLLFRGTFANRVPGQALFLKDLNSRSIDPNKDFVLNPSAWSDPAEGQWGTAAAFYDDYRFQRRPSEQVGIGRSFQIREGMTFQFRGEFFNVFNRTQMGDPTASNALATQVRNANGVPTAGFGRINALSLGGNPRRVQLLARFEF